jgi:predicted GNAT family N-acyltransferase
VKRPDVAAESRVEAGATPSSPPGGDPVRIVEIEPGSAVYGEARELRYDALYAVLDLPRSLVEDADGSTYSHFAALSDGRLVGYARLHLEGGDSHAYQVVVVEEMRRAGVGRALMDALAVRARAEGRDVLELDARDYAVGFYERLGYEVVSDEFLSRRTGTPHRKMRRVL